MSLLSSLAQVALQSALGGNTNNTQGQSQNLVEGVLKMIQNTNTGGIAGLVDKFQKSGLGDVAASWVGNGDNHPVSADQVVAALGQDQVNDLAKQAGIPEEKGAEVLSQVLPTVVNDLTPEGKIPEANHLGTLAKVVLGGLGVAGVAMAAKAAASAYNNSHEDVTSPDDSVAVNASTSAEDNTSNTSTAAPAADRTYTVLSGDSLSKIAKHVYGDGNRWMQIFEANRDKLRDPDHISPGQVLRIP